METNLLSHKQQLLLDAVRKLVRRGSSPSLDRLLAKRRPVEIAVLFAHLNDWEGRNLLSALLEYDISFCANVLVEIEPALATSHLQGIERDQMIQLIHSLPSGDATSLVRRLPDETAAEIMPLLKADVSEEVEELLGYAQDTAAGLMSTDFFALKEDVTVAEAIKVLQQDSASSAMAFYVYIVNDSGRMVGVLSLRSLLTHPPETRLGDIMITEVLSVNAYTDQEEVARTVARYDLVAIPVLDEYNKLIGIVTVDDVIDVIREEATEDILKMAGTAEDDMVTRTTLTAVRSRTPWLIVTLIAGIVASEIIWAYESTLQGMILLAGFMPVIVGLSGNAGNQSAALIARGISLSQIETRALRRSLFREVRAALALGLLCGLVLAGFILARYSGMWSLSLVVGVSATLSILIAMLFGAISPLVLQRLHLDPNMATGPLVSTVVDVSGILVYFSLAKALLTLLK